MAQLFAQSLSIALQAIAHNKLRAVLTSLGIIFGVGSVIAMLARLSSPNSHVQA